MTTLLLLLMVAFGAAAVIAAVRKSALFWPLLAAEWIATAALLLGVR